MQDKTLIESFDEVEARFDEVDLALEDCVRAGAQRAQESGRRLARLERAVAELAAGQTQLQAAVQAAVSDLREARVEMHELRLRLDRLEQGLQALQAATDQLSAAAERRLEVLESSMSRFRLELRNHREEFKLLSDDVKVLKSDVEVLKSDVKVLKSDVATLKGDVKALRGDHEALSVSVQKLRLEMRSEFARLESKMDAGFAKLKREMDAGFAELKREMDAGFAELKREMGNLGNSIGAFVEDFSVPSLRRIITSLHDVDFIAPFVFFDANTGQRELDAFAVTRTEAGAAVPLEAFVFEIKRKFNEPDLEQLRNNITALRKAMPQFRECPIYAYLLAASIREAQKQKVWDAGIHLVTFGDRLFDLPVPPANFEFDYEIGMPKRPAGRGRPQRAVPRPHPPFYLQQLKRVRDAVKTGQLH